MSNISNHSSACFPGSITSLPLSHSVKFNTSIAIVHLVQSFSCMSLKSQSCLCQRTLNLSDLLSLCLSGPCSPPPPPPSLPHPGHSAPHPRLHLHLHPQLYSSGVYHNSYHCSDKPSCCDGLSESNCQTAC